MLNVRAINKDGQSALHTLCWSVNKDKDIVEDLLTAAAWLISMGCPLDVKWHEKTADVIAEENGHAALCDYLRKELRLGHTPGMSRPVYFKGYTYLSLRFLSQILETGMKPDFSAMSAVCLSVDVASSSGTVLVPAQSITEVHYKADNGTKMWWGYEYFLQSPLENISDLAEISICLIDKGHGKIAETVISLKRSSIDSGSIVLDLKIPGTQPRTHSTLLVDLSLQSL